MGKREQSGMPSDFDGIVRLFPLPNLVLFPNVIQNLHIFEPRYCEMLSDALESDDLITMALLDRGWEENYESQPRIARSVCIGRIINHTPLGDGRHNIMLAGLHRARIVEELDVETAFRQARVELIEEQAWDQTELAEAAKYELVKLFRSFLPPEIAKADPLSEVLVHQLPLGVLTDIVAFAINLPLPVKQMLLGEPSEEVRYHTLMEQLRQLKQREPEPVVPVVNRTRHRTDETPPFSVN
jgi:ATP-dependent Lon protease